MRVAFQVAICSFLATGYLLWLFAGKSEVAYPEEPSIAKSEITIPDKPHIVYILADDLGWSDVGYNNPYIISPTIDALAREGVILNQSYVFQSCSPSRASLMSGYYSYRLGVQTGGMWQRLPQGVPLNYTLLPRKLKQLGYSTYMVGKWHLGFCKKEYTPNGRGFDQFYGYYLPAGDHYTHMASGFLDLHDNYVPDWSQNGTYSSYLFSDKAVEYINNHDKTKPMFLYLAYQSVHSPLQVPQKYYDMYPLVKNENRRIKMGMITAMDDGIAKVVRSLKQNGMWRNTLLVFSSDNGAPQNERYEGNNWPLLGTKKTLFEGGTRAVGFINGNILPKKGYTYNGLIHIVDWYPTFVRLAGGKNKDPEMDGIDVWNALSMNLPSPRKECIYNILEKWDLAAIRVGNYKLHIIGGPRGSEACWAPPPEVDGKYGNGSCIPHGKDVFLFNLKDDPLEQHNLASKMPEKVKQLINRIEEEAEKGVPAFEKSAISTLANPENFGGVFSPGWC